MNSVGQILAIAATVVLLGTTGALAAEMNGANTPTATDQNMSKQWEQMRQNAVSAQSILRGNFTNGLNPVGQVGNLVLSKDLSRVQYVVFNTPNPPWSTYIGNGYVDFHNVRLEDNGYGTINVSVANTKNVRGPEELEITKQEGKSRLVSYIIDEDMRFKDGSVHKIHDLLIDPNTGALTYYVVGSEPDKLFSIERRAVPTADVHYTDGMFTSDLTFDQVEEKQPFDTRFL